MTISKVLATSAVVGLMSSAAFANEINFSQTGVGASVSSVTFTQTGTGNIISDNGTTATAAATVVGSLDTLMLEQIGDSNKSSFAISTTDPAPYSIVNTLLKGTGNTSALEVALNGQDTFEFRFGFKGDNNSVAAKIATESLVVVDSIGNAVSYTIDQSLSTDPNGHKIQANVTKAGDNAATVAMNQSGSGVNKIVMGAPSSYGLFTGTTGLTLNGAATVSIAQSSANASYTAIQTVTAGGTLTVSQTN